tara:strand:- start:5928 stop:7364 length:1437 start_codon:yes stop_codon:yes gene_type:complete
MDFDSTNYSTDELLNILEINQGGNYNLDSIFTSTKNSMDSTRLSDDMNNKEQLLDFLIGSFNRVCQHFQYNIPEYMNMELDRLKNKLLTNSSNMISGTDPSNFVINQKVGASGLYGVNDGSNVKQGRRVGIDRRDGRSVGKKKFRKINPIRREIVNSVLTINTKYRNNYYGTKSTDFLFTIPNSIKNVTALKISNAELQNTYYTISNYLKSNIFYVHLFSLLANGIDSGMYKIEIPEGNYTSEQAVAAINGSEGFGLKRAKLYTDLNQVVDLSNIIQCTYDSMTKKVIFSLKPGVQNYTYDLDFVLHGQTERDIAENLGWLLGYHKPYYSFNKKIIDDKEYLASYKQIELDTVNGVSITHEGFQPDAPADFSGTKFFLIEVNDFNNNSIQSFYYPSTFNSMKLKDLLGKIPNNVLATILFEDSFGPTNPTRYYQGPVNIEKLHIRLLDEHGIVVDLNNVDFTLTFELEILNVHYEMLD